MHIVITLKLSLHLLAIAAYVYAVSMHFIVQPCPLVIAAISPKVCTMSLSLAVSELALISVGIRKDILPGTTL